MTTPMTTQPYQPQHVEVIYQTNDLRVVEITLAPLTETPRHIHTAVEEICYCLEGELTSETKDGSSFVQKAGDRKRFPASSEHQLSNRSNSPCRFLLIHGVGQFDFTPVTK